MRKICDLLSQPLKIKVTLSGDFINESQWVYLISLVKNEEAFEDSVFINKGQKEFYFNKEIAGLDEDCLSVCKLLFSGKKYLFIFYPQAGENIQINFPQRSFTSIIKVEGSPGSVEIYNFFEKQSLFRPITLRLRDSISKTTDETVLKELNDSLDYYVNYIRKDFWIEAFSTAKTLKGCCAALLSLKSAVSMEKYDSLLMEMKQRFPKNNLVENFDKQGGTPATEASKQATSRLRYLLGFPPPSNNDKKLVLDAKLKEELEKIITYKTGDIIKNITLKGLNGKLVSLFDEKTPYVLIDFWASWCAPCRGEIPGLKASLAKHKGLFSVYAISIDDDVKSWKSAIENDKTEVFTHVNAGTKEREGQIITKQFGVRAIPANFLIDKDHKIIAVNLFGKNLEKTISELQNKN